MRAKRFFWMFPKVETLGSGQSNRILYDYCFSFFSPPPEDFFGWGLAA